MIDSSNNFWEKTYQQNTEKMIGLCYRYVNNKQVAEDLAHDAFIKAIEKSNSFKNKGKFEAWLRKITVNTALQYIRSQKIEKPFENWIQENVEEIPYDNLNKNINNETSFSEQELFNAVNCLPNHHKLVFNLYVLDNFSHAEIGKELNISTGTSRSHLARARKQLRKELIQKLKNKQEKKENKKALILLLLPCNCKYIDRLYNKLFKNFRIKPQNIFNANSSIFKNAFKPESKSSFSQFLLIAGSAIIIASVAYLYSENKISSSENKEIINPIENSQNEVIDSIIPKTSRKNINLKDITDYVATKTETFHINPTKDTLIRCKKGTIIYFPENCFEFINNNTTVNHAKIIVKECYTISDFISNYLSTASGNNLLETGGMAHISASSNGQQLKIKEEKKYAVYFPKHGNTKEMNLYYGKRDESGKIDWTKKQNESNDLKSNQTDSIFSYRLYCSAKERVNTGKIINSKTVGITYKIPELTINFCIPQQDYYTISFVLNNYGKLESIHFDKNNFTKEYDKTILKSIRDTIPEVKVLKSKVFNKSLYRNYIIATYACEKNLDTTLFKEKHKSFKDNAITKIDSEELKYYTLTASKLDWLNCDKLNNLPVEKIEYTIRTNSPNETMVLVAFKEANSILQSKVTNKATTFNYVPINQPVTIIGISYEDGKPKMQIAETITSKDGFELTGFESFSLNQLDKKLKNLKR